MAHSPSSLLTVLFLLWSCLPVFSYEPYLAPYPEQYILEPFIGALGGGPSGGPLVSSGTFVGNVCGDKHGNRYFSGDAGFMMLDTNDVVKTVGGIKYGYKDGPAPEAEYKLGDGGYYSSWTMSCSPDGDIFASDGGNKCIRRIFKTDSCWMTETWAGGGTGSLANIGDSAPSRSIDISGTIVSQCNCRGEVIIHTLYQAKIYRVSADGKTITYIAKVPVPEKETYTTVSGAADTIGNVYFMNRCPQTVYKVDRVGNTAVLCGLHTNESGYTGDTLPHYKYLWMVGCMTVAPDGSAVYANGGDTYFICRIPTDSTKFTSTLGYNGRFWVTPTPATNSGSPKYIDTTKTDFKVFKVCNLQGGDPLGGIYTALYSWEGFSHAGFPTQISRLKRIR